MSRTGGAGPAVTVAALIVLIVQPVLPAHLAWLAGVAAGLILLVALALRDPASLHVPQLVFFISIWPRVWPAHWPFFLLAPLLLYGAIAASAEPLRRSSGWLRAGEFGKAVRALVLLTVLVSTLALTLWFALANPDLRGWIAAVPDWPLPWLIPVGIGFALLNAAIEEATYRGILLEGLDRAIGLGPGPVVLQAVAFGTLHFHGVPSGWIGVGLATVYGLMLGAVRRRAGGMLAPFAAHVLADLVIFTTLALWIA